MYKKSIIFGTAILIAFIMGCSSNSNDNIVLNESEGVEESTEVVGTSEYALEEKVEEATEEQNKEIQEEQSKEIEINETNFPDAIFREYISNKFDVDNDNILSEDEMLNVTEIGVGEKDEYGCFNIDLSDVSDCKGIEFFTNLREFYCMNYSGVDIDFRSNSELMVLSMDGGQLEELDISNNPNLINVSLQRNTGIKELDFSNNKKIEIIDLYDCSVENIILDNNNNLKDLLLFKTNVMKLDISKCDTVLDWVENGTKEEIHNEYTDSLSYHGKEDEWLYLNAGVELITE